MNFLTLEPSLPAEAFDFADVPPRSPATSLILAALAHEKERVQARREPRVSWSQITRKLIAAFRFRAFRFPVTDFATSASTASTPAGLFFYKVQSPCGYSW
jgi:hypothetical protein